MPGRPAALRCPFLVFCGLTLQTVAGTMGGSDMNVWEPQPSETGQTVHWRIGPLDMWVRHVEGEWHVGVSHGADDRPPVVDAAEPEEDLAWRRWAAEIVDPLLKAAPVLPDRSVIVRPAVPLQILPGQEARFFVGVPVLVRISVAGKHTDELVMCEEPTTQLTKSWFGTPIEGEPCYALRTRARSSLDEITPAADRAVCPLMLRNESGDTLDFERLCLRARHLSVYRGSRHIWTSEGKITFKGEDSLTHVTYGDGPPAFDDAAELLSPARDVPGRSFVSKTFDNLKSFSLF